MSTLSEYLKGKSLSQRAFASKVGVDQSVISRVVRGEIKPSLDLAAAIERETNGKVRAVSWADLPGQGRAS